MDKSLRSLENPKIWDYFLHSLRGALSKSHAVARYCVTAPAGEPVHKAPRRSLAGVGAHRRVNGRCAVILYARRAEDDAWHPHSCNVLEVSEGAIASVVAFVGPLAPSLFSAAGLPMQPADPPMHH